MIKTRLVFYLSFLFTSAGFAQLTKGQIDPAKVPVPDHHYQAEYTFDSPVDLSSWAREEAGLNVSFATTNESYLRCEAPRLRQKTPAWEGTGWKGERLNAQLLVWSTDTVRQIRFKVNDLAGAGGRVISKDNIQLNLVRYVLSNYPYGAANAQCAVGTSNVAYLMPDRFDKVERFDLPGKTVRPIWITFDIPAGTEPGAYTSSLEVISEDQHATLDIKINVQNQILPDPQDWKFRLDLWQNPWVVAWYYHLEPWSDEHMALLKKHLALYANAGGKYITTYAVHSPWSDNSYMIEGGMIDWIRQANGTFRFDYTIFDRYVQLAIDAGIDDAITIYTPVPWGYRFRYLDERSGNYVYEEWSPESGQFSAVWNHFLDDLKVHLEKKGWFEKTYLGINENPLNITLAAANVIKANSKAWKITYAGDWHQELAGLLDDYSPILGKEPSLKELADRKSRGFTTTYYVCCTPQRPNNFVFSPPVEGQYISWYAAAYGYDGFLRWAYDAWPADPIRDARHTLWPAGDCFLIYPGGASTIRFEKLREGISDYEKIRIVRELAAKSTNKKIKNSLKEFDAHLASLVDVPEYSQRNYDVQKTTEAVVKGKKMIDALGDALGAELKK